MGVVRGRVGVGKWESALLKVNIGRPVASWLWIVLFGHQRRQDVESCEDILFWESLADWYGTESLDQGSTLR